MCGEKVCNNADRAGRSEKIVGVLYRGEQLFLNRSTNSSNFKSAAFLILAFYSKQLILSVEYSRCLVTVMTDF